MDSLAQPWVVVEAHKHNQQVVADEQTIVVGRKHIVDAGTPYFVQTFAVAAWCTPVVVPYSLSTLQELAVEQQAPQMMS